MVGIYVCVWTVALIQKYNLYDSFFSLWCNYFSEMFLFMMVKVLQVKKIEIVLQNNAVQT